MFTVVWKEYREHRLIWIANAGLGCLLLLAIVQLMGTTGQARGLDRNQIFGVLATALTLAGTYGVVCGSMLLAGERESGTLPFLDALPGPRLRLWFIKLLIGLMLTIAQALLLWGMLWYVSFDSYQYPLWGVAIGLVVCALSTFTWGFFASAFGQNVLAAAATGVGLLCAATMFFALIATVLTVAQNGLRSVLGPRLHQPELVPIIAWLATVGLGLAGSAIIFCRQDVARAPKRTRDEPDTPIVSSPWTVRVLWWLNRQQGLAAFLGFGVAGILAGLALPWQGFVIWPVVTLLLGIFCGAGTFVSEQMNGSKRFLAEQRLPLGRIWRSKMLFWFAVAVGVATMMLLAGGLRIAIKHSDEIANRGILNPLGNAIANHWLGRVAGLLVFGTTWLITGFSIGQFLTILFRKGIVAVVLAMMVGGLAATAWVPAIVCGGLHFWQVLFIPVLLLATTRFLMLPWATDRLETRRPIAILVLCGVLVGCWILGNCWYRQAEVPVTEAPFDVQAFEARFPDFDADKSGELMRRALGELGQQEKRIALMRAQPTRALCYPPTMRSIREQMEQAALVDPDDPTRVLDTANPWGQTGGAMAAPTRRAPLVIFGGTRFVSPHNLIFIEVSDGDASQGQRYEFTTRTLWLRRFGSLWGQGGWAADPIGSSGLAPILALNTEQPSSTGKRVFRDQLREIIEQGWPEGEPEVASWLDSWCTGTFLPPDWLIHLRAACQLPLGIVENVHRVRPTDEIRSVDQTALASDLLTARSIQLQARGQHEQALDHLFLVFRLSRQQRNLALPACYAAGLQAEMTAMRGLYRWLRNLPDRPDLLRKALAELSRHEKELCHWSDSIRADYLMIRHELDVPSAWVPMALNPYLEKNDTSIDPAGEAIAFALTIPWEAQRARSILNAYYAGRLHGSELPYREFAHQILATENAAGAGWQRQRSPGFLRWTHQHLLHFAWVRPTDGPLATLTPEAMASYLESSWVHDVVQSSPANRTNSPVALQPDLCRLALCDLRAARIRLALMLFRRESGSAAERLEQLVPRFLEEVPADPFGGEAMKYLPASRVAEKLKNERVRRGMRDLSGPGRPAAAWTLAAIPPKHGIIYSVGPDLFDEGGEGIFDLAGPRRLQSPQNLHPNAFWYELKQLSPDFTYLIRED